MHRCAREGTPRPESSAVRAHVPAAFWAFADSWKAIFHSGVCDHAIKDLCRVYISRTVKCEFCGNQRSIKAIERRARGDAVRRPAQLRELATGTTSGRRPRCPTPRRSPGASRPTRRASGAGCTRTSRSRSWSSSAARSRSPSASRAGSGCSASTTTSTWPAPTPRWRPGSAPPRSSPRRRPATTTGPSRRHLTQARLPAGIRTLALIRRLMRATVQISGQGRGTSIRPSTAASAMSVR